MTELINLARDRAFTDIYRRSRAQVKSGRAAPPLEPVFNLNCKRYGRFPAYLAPFRTVVGYQACHLDLEFYERFYRPEALTSTQRVSRKT